MPVYALNVLRAMENTEHFEELFDFEEFTQSPDFQKRYALLDAVQRARNLYEE